jgi:hypothetical protein
VERLRHELEAWLSEQFPGAQVILDPVRPGSKIGGIIAWNGFHDLEPIDRQSLLWRALRDHFNREDQIKISGLIALSLTEYAVYREPQMA